MILSDFLWMGSMGLLVPIFALLIESSVVGGNAAIVGIATSIYLITKSVVQMIAASVIDWIKGEKDDFWIMFSFSMLAAVLPLGYIFMETPLHLFIIQFINGILIGFTFPTFLAIFTRHVDMQKAGTEWGTYHTFTDISSAFTAFMGGVIATLVGFNLLIIVSVMVSILGVSLLFPLRRHLYRLRKPRHRIKRKAA